MTTIGDSIEWSDDAIQFQNTLHSGCLPPASVHMHTPGPIEASANDSKHQFLARSEGRMALKGPISFASRIKLGK